MGFKETLLTSRHSVVLPLSPPPPQYPHWLPIAYKLKSQMPKLPRCGFFQPLHSCLLPTFPFEAWLGPTERLVPGSIWLFCSFVCTFPSDWDSLLALPHPMSTSTSLRREHVHDLVCVVCHTPEQLITLSSWPHLTPYLYIAFSIFTPFLKTIYVMIQVVGYIQQL